MSWLTTLGNLFVPEPIQTRASEFADLESQLAAIRRQQAQPRPWRLASVQEALGVPAILSAVSLISNTVGSLSMEAFRSGALVTDPNQTPRLIQRPNPRTTAREFWMKTGFYFATRGEFWWWVAHRDIDGNADALYPVPPWEINVEQNDRDRLNPTIRWMDKVMPNRDMRQQMYLPSSDGLRGVGPLQLSGASVSVTVEASNWAANFFAGNLPSLIGTTDQDLDANDLQALDDQWNEKAGNLPRWMTNGMKLEVPPFDADKAQLTESRLFQVGEVARMFDMPGALLEYNSPGSSLTYQNQADIWQDFQRRCLSPHYLEPIEQEMSDLLTRSTVGRFNLDQLLRADIKTRFEVYGLGIDKGIYGPEYPQAKEGIVPGNVDFAPVPFSPPAADPGPIPTTVRTASHEVRCSKCNRLLAEQATPPYRFTCSKPTCKAVTENRSIVEQEEGVQFRSMLTALLDRPPTVIHNHLPTVEPAQVTFERGAVQVDAPPPAEVRIEAPVTVNLPEQPAPEVTVNVPEQRDRVKRIERDDNGHLIRIVEEAG